MATRRERYNIKERKDGRLEIRQVIDGVRKSFYGNTVDEVIEKYENYKAQKHIYGTALEEKEHFDDYIKQWLYCVKQKTLKPSSFDRLEGTILKWVIPTIGHIPVNKLTSIQIQELMINRMFDEGLAASTIKKAYMAVNASCKYGLGTTFRTNPCEKVTLPSKHQFEETTIRYLSDEKEIGEDGNELPSEIDRFKTEALTKMKSLDKYKHKYGISFVLILNTGLRSGELRALKWKDIDEASNTIHVCREAERGYDRSGPKKKERTIAKDTTKTQSSNRYIPLNKTAKWCLDEMKKIEKYDNDDDFIFSTDNKTLITTRNYIRALKSICKNAGLRDVKVHSLRHTFATQLFARGYDIKIISELLGHADIQITNDIYVHVIEKQKRNAVAALDEEI